MNPYKNQSQSICWDCNNACGKCSWSKSFVPVGGWTATRRDIIGSYNESESYIVTECPMFEPDKPVTKEELKRKNLEKPYRNLANAIIECAANDYRKARKKLYKNENSESALYTEKETSEFLSVLGSGGEYLLRKLNKEHETWLKKRYIRKIIELIRGFSNVKR